MQIKIDTIVVVVVLSQLPKSAQQAFVSLRPTVCALPILLMGSKWKNYTAFTDPITKWEQHIPWGIVILTVIMKHISIQFAVYLYICKLFLSQNLFSYISDLTLNKYLSYGFLHSQRATASKKEFVSAMISRANLKGTQCSQSIYGAQLHSILQTIFQYLRKVTSNLTTLTKSKNPMYVLSKTLMLGQ